MRNTYITLLTACLIAGCGRYAPPFPPEKVAPQAVKDVVATGTDKGVMLTWKTPDSDRRSKPLKQIDGFSIYRKSVASNKDLADDKVPFDLLTEIADKAIVDMEKRKAEARELGVISRRVKIDEALSTQHYEDTTVERGKSYLYKIVPTNQGGIEGEVKDFISVTYRGPESDISIVGAKKLGLEDFVSQEEAAVQ